tara:strand:- start:2930 stop:3862 length:933 start_codon:yes stop_codon:yes gene_type:complete
MKIIIELPTWLGDTVMSTPAFENLLNYFEDPEITLIGSFVAIEASKNHPSVIKTHILEKNYFNLYKNIKRYGKFDYFFSFRSSLRTKFIKFFISSNIKFQYDKSQFSNGHQVERYNNFINTSLKIKTLPGNLVLHSRKKSKNGANKILGINPGSSYGNAKRWYPKEFANLVLKLSTEFDTIIFGGPEEKDISDDIEKYLIQYEVENYQNLAGKTSMEELMSQISNLDLFITGDSGPMHLAAAFQIPTISIFGPTNHKETSQWKNHKRQIVKKNLECQPCMSKSCPLKHHACMKQILASDVMKAVEKLSEI